MEARKGRDPRQRSSMRQHESPARSAAEGDAHRKVCQCTLPKTLYIYTVMKRVPFPIDPESGKYRIPKLTAEDLREIYRANRCPEVRALLWEIHRLRQLVVRANSLQQSIGAGCYNSTLFIRDCLRRDLEGEPCIAEHKALVSMALYGPSGRPKKQQEQDSQ